MNLAKFLSTPFLQITSGRLLLFLAFQKQPPEAFYEKRCSWNFCIIHRKTPLVCEISKSTFFTENICTTTSAFSFLETATGGVLWKKCFWKFPKIHRKTSLVCEIFKNTVFTEYLWKTASAFSFSEAPTGSALWKKVFLKILQNSQENTFGLRNFQKHLFYRTPLDDCFWLFRATLLKWGTANSVWKTSDEYSLSRNTKLRSTVQVYHFFFRQD